MRVALELLIALVTVIAVTWLAWEKAGPHELLAQPTRPYSVYESGDYCIYIAGNVQTVAISAVPRLYSSNRQLLRCQ